MRHEIDLQVLTTYTVSVVTEAGVTEDQLMEHVEAITDDRSSADFSESLAADGIKNEVESISWVQVEDHIVDAVLSEEVDADENFEFAN